MAVASAVDFAEVHRLSAAEFQQMVDSGALDDMRVEFIDGLLVDMTPPSPEHDGIIVFLTTHFARALEPKRYRVRPQMGLSIANSAPQPDVAIVRADTPQPYYPATAELVVEVARSSLRRDLIAKPLIYASARVKEYWVIDVDRSRVVVHRDPSEGGYREHVELGPDAALDASVVGLGEIRIADVLAAAQRP